MFITLSLLSGLLACEKDPDADADGSPASLDCDDENPNINPSATELCDGVDNDCDGLIDDADDEVSEASLDSWYSDLDGDGFGASRQGEKACDGPPDTVNKGGDCADDDPAIYPGAAEVCDGLDNDCDGVSDDLDSNLDQSTRSTWYRDQDGDGFGSSELTTQACAAPDGYVDDQSDCDDSSAAVNPEAEEICEDGLDNDCSGDAPECVFSGQLDIAQAGLVLSSSARNFGNSLGVDDFNGDGQPDLVIGAPGASKIATEAGQVLVFSEGMSPGGSPAATSSFVSFNENARTGTDVAMLGDVSGDGYADLLIGHQASTDESAALYRGAAEGFDTKVYLFNGELGLSSTDSFGSEVAPVGDTDRDGRSELAVGASTAGSLGREGAVYLWQDPSTLNEPDSATTVITGQSNDYLGSRDTVLGADFDGDGYGDLLTGAPSQARFYLNYGKFGSNLDVQDSDVVVSGVDEDDWLGLSPASGDLDQDGYADLVVGATGERDASGKRVGGTHIFPGSASRPSAETSSTSSRTLILGSKEFDSSGSAHVVADVNGDGELDLFIGQLGARDQDGAAYLFYGPIPSGELDTSTADVILLGDQDGKCGNVGTLAIADLSGDGSVELIMGCPRLGSEQEGAVFVFFAPGE